ncbi:GIY-YIG nuclease family protein [Vibrio astriarenae]
MKNFTFNGVKYSSIASFFRIHESEINCSLPTFKNRINEGLEIDQAMVAEKKRRGSIKIEPQVIEGKQYLSIPEIATEYGVNHNTMYQRYNRGRRGDELILPKERKDYTPPAIQEPKKKYVPASAETIEYAGTVYTSVKGICREYGVDRGTFRKRRKKGLTIGQCLGQEPIVDGRTVAAKVKHYELDGKQYTAPQLSKMFGVPVGTLRERLKKGASLFQALSKHRLDNGTLLPEAEIERNSNYANVPTMIVDGKAYSSYQALGDDFGIKQHVIRQRIVDLGWSPEEAVMMEGRNKTLVVDDKRFATLQEAADEFGIQIETLRNRRANNWTPRQIVGLDPAPNTTVYTWNGMEFTSINEISDYFGIPKGLVSSRLNRMSLEEAVKLGDQKLVGTGRYNMTILTRDEALATKPSLLYFVKMTIDERVVYKVGITTSTLAERMSGYRKFQWEEVAIGRATLLECYKLEQSIHDMMEDRNIKDIDGSIMDGYTELFDFNEDDVATIKELMAELL